MRFLSLVLSTVLFLGATARAQEEAPPGRYGAFPFLHDARAVSPIRPAGALAFEAEHGRGWNFQVNENTGTLHRVYGRLGAGSGALDTEAEVLARSEAVLRQHADLLGIDEARLRRVSVRQIRQVWSVIYEDRWSDLAVRGSRVEVRLHETGGLMLLGADTFRVGTAAPGTPTLPAAEAELVAMAHVGAGPQDVSAVTEVIYGVPSLQGTIPVRGYEVILDHFNVFVNGTDGEIDYVQPRDHAADVVGDAAGFASPPGTPDTPANPPVEQTMPFLDVIADGVNVGNTDENGEFDFTVPGTGPVLVEATLDGPFVNVDSESGANLTFSGMFDDGVPGQILFNTAPTEIATAQVNAFILVNEAHAFLKLVDPTFTDADSPVQCNVNVGGSCNAFFVGATNSMNFLLAGGACPNTAYGSIVFHEYNHFVVNQIFSGVLPSGGYNEGICDTLAILASNDPRIGLDFLGPGTVIRDADIDDRVFPDDIGGQIHQEGLIIAGAFWDTRTELVDALGDPDGVIQAGALYLGSMQFQPMVISPDITVDVLMVDDNDGDISNGTPNYDAIATGFGLHGLDAPPITGMPDEFVRGDVDADGNLNGLIDGLALLNFQFVPGSPAPPCLDAADVNDDGNVNGLVDGLQVLNFQFLPGSPPPSPPYPDCGADPSSDTVDCVSYPGLLARTSPQRGRPGALRAPGLLFILDDLGSGSGRRPGFAAS